MDAERLPLTRLVRLSRSASRQISLIDAESTEAYIGVSHNDHFDKGVDPSALPATRMLLATRRNPEAGRLAIISDSLSNYQNPHLGRQTWAMHSPLPTTL